MYQRTIVLQQIRNTFSQFELCEVYQGRKHQVSRKFLPFVFSHRLLIDLDLAYDFSRPEPRRVFRAKISCVHQSRCDCFIGKTFDDIFTVEELMIEEDQLAIDEQYEF